MSLALSQSGFKSDRRLPQIDGLRALGMLMVYVFHNYQFGGNPAVKVNVGGHQLNLIGFVVHFGAGVDLFMIISGFCLFWPLCQSEAALQNWNPRVYWHRRVKRILPPYYAAILYAIVVPMILVAIFHALHWKANWQPIPSAWQLLTHFLFIHSLFPSTWDGITGAFWSLGLEMQFYVLFPLTVFAYRRYGTRVLWWMISVSIIFNIGVMLFVHVPIWYQICAISFLSRWIEFAMGMFVALGVAKYRREGRTTSAWAGTGQIACALLVYVVAILPFPGIYAIFPLYPCFLSISFSLLIFALCTSRTPLAKIFTNRVAVALGTVSYSLYLIHQPTAWYISQFIQKLMHVSGLSEFCLMITLGFCGVLGVGYLFFLIFEAPTLYAPQPAGVPVTVMPPQLAPKVLANGATRKTPEAPALVP